MVQTKKGERERKKINVLSLIKNDECISKVSKGSIQNKNKSEQKKIGRHKKRRNYIKLNVTEYMNWFVLFTEWL